jgi:hypothetical protein
VSSGNNYTKRKIDFTNIKIVPINNQKYLKNNFVEKKKIIQNNTDINNSSTHYKLINDNNFNFNFIENAEQIAKFETNQFQKIIDYGYIYQTLKDNILLILLSLNTEKAKIFFEKRKKCINILRLEKEMFYLSHSTNVNIFDKLQNKIDLINKNIFTSHLNIENKETSYYEN